MPTRLTGLPALAYTGVEAPQPPNITFHPRAPLQSDYQNFNTGDLWVDTSNFPPNPPEAENIWMLVSKQGRVGIWVNFSGGTGDLDSLTGDTGGPVFGDAANNINIFSGIPGLTVDGNPATNTLTLNASQGGNLFQGLSADDSPPNVFPDINGIIALLGTAGNIVTAEDAVNNAIVFDVGGNVSTQYTADDANIAVPSGGNLNVFGLNGITTSVPVPGGDTLNINGIDSAATCSFSAFIDVRINNITGDGTAYSPILYDTELYDIGNDFDISTGIFTAPVDGIYMFSASVRYLKGSATLTRMRTRFQTSIGTYSIWNHSDLVSPGTGFLTIAEWNPSNTLIIELNANDTVEVGIIAEGDALTVSLEGLASGGGLSNRFSGSLIARL